MNYNLFNIIFNLIFEGLNIISNGKIEYKGIKLELAPKQIAHEFDLATNIAMIASKKVGIPPVELGNILCKKLIAHKEMFSSARCDQPGFINIKLTNTALINAIEGLLRSDSFGFDKTVNNGQRVNVEFVSANPTGPMHIGHARGAIFGDVISTMLKNSGYEVTKEYYVNDAGTQINILLKSTMVRYMQACGDKNVAIPEGHYPGEYLIPLGEELKTIYGTSLLNIPKEEAFLKIKSFVLNKMMNTIKATLKKLDIEHDVFFSEQEVISGGDIITAINILRQQGLTYFDTPPAPKGKHKEDWDERKQELFKTTEFGDDADRPLTKGDGTFAYFAPDIGYHYNKFKRGFKKMILVLGSDHKGYIKRIQAAVKVISNDTATVQVEICELVNFIKNDEKQKMSKRSGNILTVDQVIDEVGADVLRFTILTNKSNTVMNFDLEKSKEQSLDNPLFYTQYAYARCCSIERQFVTVFGDKVSQNANLNLLDEYLSNEQLLRTLVLLLNQYPDMVKIATNTIQPHLLVTYAVQLSAAFHQLWSCGKIRFIKEGNAELSLAMLQIAKCVKIVIGSILNTIKVKPMEKL